MFTFSKTRCYPEEATWQPRMLTDWIERDGVADDNIGTLLDATAHGTLGTATTKYITKKINIDRLPQEG